MCIDDISGKELNSKAVKLARQLELRTFKDMEVYEYMRREEAASRGKTVGVRWVDSLKGTTVKSRLVAQEFASVQGDRDDIFAATPPWMAREYVISDTASRGRSGRTSRRISVMDVKRAFLYGEIEEEIYIELPEEDEMKSKGYIGKLKKAMYGTRSAPLIWQKVVMKKMKEMGFDTCPTTPCLYHHKTRDFLVVDHVDDFLGAGEPEDLLWVKQELEKTFELTYKLVGPGQAATFLGRTITWSSEGITIEGENKYIDTMMKEC